MRKLMMPAAMLAMTVLVAIAPVVAQDTPTDPGAPIDVVAPSEGSETPQEVTPPVTEEPPPPPPLVTEELPPPLVIEESPLQITEETPPLPKVIEETTPLPKVTAETLSPILANLPEVEDQEANVGDGVEQGSGDPETDSGNVEEVEEQEADNDGDTEQGGNDQEADSGDDTKVETQKNDKDDGDAKQEARNQKDEDEDDEDDEDADDEDDGDEDDGNGVEQDIGQDADSGDIDQSVDVSNSGDYAQQCVAVLQAANTGNSQNAQGVAQDESEADDIGADGGGINVSPQIVQDCRQIVLQIVMAQQQPRDRIVGGSRERAALIRKAYAGRSGAGQARIGQPSVGQARVGQAGVGQAGVGQATIGQNRISRVGGQPNAAATPKTLPRTGGFSGSDAALLGLGAGVLITGGGLLIRKTSQ